MKKYKTFLVVLILLIVLLLGVSLFVENHGCPQSFVFRVLEGTEVGQSAHFYVKTGAKVKRITLFKNDIEIKEISDTDVFTREEWEVCPGVYDYYVEVEKDGKIFKSNPITVNFSGDKKDFPPVFMKLYLYTTHSYDLNPGFYWLGQDVEVFFIIRDFGHNSGIKNVRLFRYIERGGSREIIETKSVVIHWTERRGTTECFRFTIGSQDRPGTYLYRIRAEDWGENRVDSDWIEIKWKKYWGIIR